MDKQKVSSRLELAVAKTRAEFQNFQGVVVFGSFLHSPSPRDLDLVPVLSQYVGCWNLQPDEDGFFDDVYADYECIEQFFGTFFAEFCKNRSSVFKTQYKKDALIHIESLVALDDLPALKQRLDHYGTHPKHFIGSEEARQKMMQAYELGAVY